MRRRRTLDDRSAQALLSGRVVDSEPELTAFVAALSAQAVAVEPSASLAALLADGFVPAATTASMVLARAPRAGIRRWALQVSLGTAACVAVSVGAATNELPAPVQRTVADVVEALTPLTVPRPPNHPTPEVPPVHRPTTAPASRVEPTDEPSDDPSEGTRQPSSPPTEHADDRGTGTGDGRGAQPESGASAAPRTDGRDEHPATSPPDGGVAPSSPPAPLRSEQPDSHPSSGSDDHSGSGPGGFDDGSSSHGG